VNDLINSLIITMYTTHKHLASDTDIVAETGCGGLYKNCQTETFPRRSAVSFAFRPTVYKRLGDRSEKVKGQ